MASIFSDDCLNGILIVRQAGLSYCKLIVLVAHFLAMPVVTHTADAIVLVRVVRGHNPVSNAQVMLTRSVSGRVDGAQWVGVTNASGQAVVTVASGAGYYVARAVDSLGVMIGKCYSVPVGVGRQTVVVLRAGERGEVVVIEDGHSFRVTVDRDSVVAGIGMPVRMTAMTNGFENGVLRKVVDETYQGAGVRVSVLADGQDVSNVSWRGVGVTDLGNGAAVLNGDGWINGQSSLTVMSTKTLDNFAVVVRAEDGVGRLDGLTVDAAEVRRYDVRALEDGVETTVVSGDFEVEVIPTDRWGNPSTKVFVWPRGVDSLTASLALLDSRIDTGDVLKDIPISFFTNQGDAWINAGRSIVHASGNRFPAIAPNREGEGLVVDVRTFSDVDSALYTTFDAIPSLYGLIGRTPELQFFPTDIITFIVVAKVALIDGFIRAFGTYQGDADYSLEMDVNRDGMVNFADFVVFTYVFGGQ